MNAIFSTSDWAKVQEVFAAAAELPPVERSRYLDDACKSHPELRESVEAWLAMLEADETLNQIVGAAAVRVLDTGQPVVCGRLGSYQLTGNAGRGGMGPVYRSIRADDIYRQEVAIKVASQGLLTPAGLQRHFFPRSAWSGGSLSLSGLNTRRCGMGGTDPWAWLGA